MTLTRFRSRNHPQQVTEVGARPDVDDRGTPPEVFDPLHERFQFTLDVAASHHNAKLERYLTVGDDGLTTSWAGHRVWCNPPYSDIDTWVRKAWVEWGTGAELIVMLLPANRTEQLWWQAHVEPHRDRPDSPLRVEFLAGRLRFLIGGQGTVPTLFGGQGTAYIPDQQPPFGCCLLIWEPEA